MNVKFAVIGSVMVASLLAVGGVTAVPASAAPAPFHCDSGLTPGFPDSTGTPTSCVGPEGVPQLMWLDCSASTHPGFRAGIGLDNYNYNSCVRNEPLATPARPTKAKFMTVRRGDTLWRIAVRAYGSSARDTHAGQQYRKIMRLNHLHSARIHAGQRLRVR